MGHGRETLELGEGTIRARARLEKGHEREGHDFSRATKNARDLRSVTNVAMRFLFQRDSDSWAPRCCLRASAQSASAPQLDSATFDSDGTAHVIRVVPMPSTISPEAQKWLASLAERTSSPQTLAERRISTDAWRARGSAEARKLYPVNIAETRIAGVRTDVITPLAMPEANRGRVLINLHGGGFVSDSGSLVEGVPISNLTRIKVVSVYYRLAPENPFPAAVDDVVAVYKELLKTYNPRAIGIFGTSAGAILTCEVTVRLKQLGIPLPAALGAFTAVPVTRGRFSPWRDSLASCNPWIPNGHPMILILEAQTARIRCCLLCSRTSEVCLRHCWSPVRAICC